MQIRPHIFVCPKYRYTTFSSIRIVALQFVNIYAPLQRREAYCFAPVGRSVDQMMSAHYLENLSLNCYDIVYVGWW
jgi:hypothetical protein